LFRILVGMNPLYGTTRIGLHFCLLFNLLTTGCSSTLERAEEHLREGRSDEALSMITKAREENDRDPELISAERRIRQQWLSDKLIQVRLLRLGGNLESSGKLLREVLDRQSKWVLIPTGAVFSTQAEEVHLLAGQILNRIRLALKNEKPLLASELLLNDETLLRDKLKIDPAAIRREVRDAVAKLCEKEGRNLNHDDHFHLLFIRRTCSFDKSAPAEAALRPIATRSSVRLFQKLEPHFEVPDLSLKSRHEIGDELEKTFEKSIWYETAPPPQAERLALGIEIRGSLKDELSSRTAYRSKPFSVQVPFEERTIRKKKDRNGLSMLFEILAWALTTYVPNHETDNGDGTVTVYETRYRTETRYHTYEVKEFTQTLTADWNIRLMVPRAQSAAAENPLSAAFRFHETFRIISDEHSTRFPDADIYPETKKTLTKEDWIKTINRKLMDQVGSELNSAWVEKFCFFQKTQAPLTESELQHRCIYGANGRAPAETASWFMRKYGIEIETWRRLVGMSESGR
jgi:hypothetical protein